MPPIHSSSPPPPISQPSLLAEVSSSSSTATAIRGSHRLTRLTITNPSPQATGVQTRLPSGAECFLSRAWHIVAVGSLSITSTCSPPSSTGSRRGRRPIPLSPPVRHSQAAAARSAPIQSTRSTTETVTPRTPATSNARAPHINSKRFAVMSSRSIPRHIYCAALAAAMLLAAGAGACAQPTPGQATSAAVAKPLPFISPIFCDNMVLQRGKLDTIWGWSDPGDTVLVQIGENTATGTAGPDRRWQVKIQPPAPGGPYTVKITGHQSAELHNVLVGAVWLCGGQSNMGLPLR